MKNNVIDDRPDWDPYFMEIARVVRKRSTCLRRHVGAVIVKDRRILATGYNGAPTGIAHCAQTGCLREKLNVPSGERHELCRGIHAEQNAIVQAAYLGVSISGSTLYCTNQPCILCAKMIINAGVQRVVIEDGYPDESAAQMLSEAGIHVQRTGKPAAQGEPSGIQTSAGAGTKTAAPAGGKTADNAAAEQRAHVIEESVAFRDADRAETIQIKESAAFRDADNSEFVQMENKIETENFEG